jgi:hypothetical protein
MARNTKPEATQVLDVVSFEATHFVDLLVFFPSAAVVCSLALHCRLLR